MPVPRYAHMRIYTHMHIHTHMYIHAHAYIHTHMYIHTHAYIHTHMYTHTRIHTYISPCNVACPLPFKSEISLHKFKCKPNGTDRSLYDTVCMHGWCVCVHGNASVFCIISNASRLGMIYHGLILFVCGLGIHIYIYIYIYIFLYIYIYIYICMEAMGFGFMSMYAWKQGVSLNCVSVCAWELWILVYVYAYMWILNCVSVCARTNFCEGRHKYVGLVSIDSLYM
jgi:hypothetical protein